MRTGRVRALVLSMACVLMLLAPGMAWAHVTVSPEEVTADSFQVLTVRAPTEKDIPTTQLRVEVPEGFTVVGVCSQCPAGTTSLRRKVALSGRSPGPVRR